MTLESICLEIEAEYGPITDEHMIRGIVMLAREEGMWNNLSTSALEIASTLLDRLNTRVALPKEEAFELDEDNFIPEATNIEETTVDNFIPDSVTKLSLGIAVNGTSAVDKFIHENDKVVGFLCVLGINYDKIYVTTAYQTGIILSICPRRKVPLLKVGDKFGPYKVLYINKR